MTMPSPASDLPERKNGASQKVESTPPSTSSRGPSSTTSQTLKHRKVSNGHSNEHSSDSSLNGILSEKKISNGDQNDNADNNSDTNSDRLEAMDEISRWR